MRTGVFLPNWIGDVVMATPAVRALRRQADDTGGQLFAIAKPYVASVLEGLGWVDGTICSKRGAGAGTERQPPLFRRLRDARLDRVVLLTNSLGTAWAAWRSGVPERIGLVREGRGPLLTTRVYEARRRGRRIEAPAIDSYLTTAYAAGADYQPPTLQLATTAEDERLADEVWRRLGLPASGPASGLAGGSVVVLNSGGAFGAAKSWPVEHFAGLAARFASSGLHVLVNCGPAERDAARQIARGANSPRVVSLADWPAADAWSVPLGLSKAVIRRCRLLVSTDSGPRFFGVAFGRPVVSLFGPTGHAATRTHYPLETPLALDMPCRPCMKASCPLGHHRCMRDLSVDRVYRAAQDLLRRTAADGIPQAA
ncbi:MAG: lipopolysaccharide heptosyltransferase II [Planctomycetota bacterium]